MKKILVVANGRKPATSTINFACEMAKSEDASLTCILIDNAGLEIVQNTTAIQGLHATGTVLWQRPGTITILETAKIFKSHCDIAHVSFRIFKLSGDPVPEIINESRYNDLLVMDPDISIYEGEEAPSGLVKDLLAGIECPAMISPGKYTGSEESIFCFDGSESSFLAIKKFTYLFPHSKKLKLTILEVNPAEKAGINDSQKKIIGWLHAHYQNIKHITLKGNAKSELFKYLLPKENRTVIMGAYGRSQISQFFRRSTADILIREIDLPFFIAHQ